MKGMVINNDQPPSYVMLIAALKSKKSKSRKTGTCNNWNQKLNSATRGHSFELRFAVTSPTPINIFSQNLVAMQQMIHLRNSMKEASENWMVLHHWASLFKRTWASSSECKAMSGQGKWERVLASKRECERTLASLRVMASARECERVLSEFECSARLHMAIPL